MPLKLPLSGKVSDGFHSGLYYVLTLMCWQLLRLTVVEIFNTLIQAIAIPAA